MVERVRNNQYTNNKSRQREKDSVRCAPEPIAPVPVLQGRLAFVPPSIKRTGAIACQYARPICLSSGLYAVPVDWYIQHTGHMRDKGEVRYFGIRTGRT